MKIDINTKQNKDILIVLIVGMILFILFPFAINKAIEEKNQNKIELSAYEVAKKNIEEAVQESYNNEGIVDAKQLEENVQKKSSNSKVEVKKEKEPEFTATVTIDEYQFSVNQEGNIQEENNNTEIPEENITIEEQKTNTIVKYKTETKTDKGITISTTEEGIVTIDGTAIEKLFIKISNNIKISSDATSFIEWANEEEVLIPKATKIKEEITILNNTLSNGQVNVVLRTEENQAEGILKLLENQTRYTAILEENIIANYIYIEEGTQIENLKFKIEITKEETDNEAVAEEILKLQNDAKTYNGITCTTNEDGTVTLNGTSTSKLFIKLTNGISVTSDGNENTENSKTEPIIINKDKDVEIEIQKISGEYYLNDQDFNVVLKYNDGNIANNTKLGNNMYNNKFIAEKDISMMYIFCSKGTTFDNCVIKPVIKTRDSNF